MAGSIAGTGALRTEVAAPIVLDDEAIRWLAESVCETQCRTVRHAGFDVAGGLDGRRRHDRVGVVESVLAASLAPVFGLSPGERYGDVFDQIGDLAVHLAKRHAFADGNKRTALQVALGLLFMNGIAVAVPDPPGPDGNEIYRWIQDAAASRRSPEDLAAFLRDHARLAG